MSPQKPKEILKSPPNPGVAPKASDFGRVTTKTEITPFCNASRISHEMVGKIVNSQRKPR
jgi:hypothetical protein